jgi:hypothetical protein
MFDVIALICALGQAPQDCVPQTARAVEKIAEVDNELGCLRWGVLSTPRGTHIGPGEYPKVIVYAPIASVRGPGESYSDVILRLAAGDERHWPA